MFSGLIARRSDLPQRGCAVQPRVAAAATLGNRTMNPSTATRLRRPCGFLLDANGATAFAVENHRLPLFQGSRSGNPGLEGVAPLGHSEERLICNAVDGHYTRSR